MADAMAVPRSRPRALPTGVLPTRTPDYHDAYALRRTASTMTTVAVERVRARIAAAWSERGPSAGPLRILSLGCGDGDLDVPLLRAVADLGPIEHTGVDVNPVSLDRFRARLVGPLSAGPGRGVTVTLIEGDLADVSDPDGYDVVLLSHVLYYVEDPIALVQRLLQDLVRTDGRLLVVHSAREGIPAVMSESGLAPFLTAEDLVAGLAAVGDECSLEVVPTELDATEVLADTPEGRTLLGFLVERDVATLTPTEAARLLVAVHGRCTTRDGRAIMPELVGLLELRCDLARAGAAEMAPVPAGAAARDEVPADGILDYRLLAERFDWPARLRAGTRGPDGRRAVLDVGCGTGRWLRALATAWPDLRLDPHDRTYTAVDPAPGAVEAATESAGTILTPLAVHRIAVEGLTPETAGQRYDLIWAIHSLYAVRPAELDAVVAGLRALLRPDGVAIVALPDAASFYIRAGELALGRRLFATEEDVTAALTRAGIPHRSTVVTYDERIPASDDLALRRYLWEESIGNSYAPEGGTSAAPSGVGLPEQPDAAWWWDLRRGDVFHFPQRVRVITFRGA